MSAYSKGGGGGREAIFRHYEIGGGHLFGEGHLLGRGRLVEEIRYSLFIPFFRADIILFKVSDELLYFSQLTFNSKMTPLCCNSFNCKNFP